MLRKRCVSVYTAVRLTLKQKCGEALTLMHTFTKPLEVRNCSHHIFAMEDSFKSLFSPINQEALHRCFSESATQQEEKRWLTEKIIPEPEYSRETV